MKRRIHKRAEDYAYEEVIEGIRRGKLIDQRKRGFNILKILRY